MSQSFGIVEDKLLEAEFFLNKLRRSDYLSFDARCYFSAFISAARSVTLSLQTMMNEVPGFKNWYQNAQAKLKANPLAPFFVEIRNASIHRGVNPLNEVTLDHVYDHLFSQIRYGTRSHVLVLPNVGYEGSGSLVDAVQAAQLYFTSLVEIIFDCYDHFKSVVDPRWYFTSDNFSAMGKTFEDAVTELGFPPEWAACAPDGDGGWHALRLQQPTCQLNDVFLRYIGREIPDPDDLDDATRARSSRL